MNSSQCHDTTIVESLGNEEGNIVTVPESKTHRFLVKFYVFLFRVCRTSDGTFEHKQKEVNSLVTTFLLLLIPAFALVYYMVVVLFLKGSFNLCTIILTGFAMVVIFIALVLSWIIKRNQKWVFFILFSLVSIAVDVYMFTSHQNLIILSFYFILFLFNFKFKSVLLILLFSLIYVLPVTVYFVISLIFGHATEYMNPSQNELFLDKITFFLANGFGTALMFFVLLSSDKRAKYLEKYIHEISLDIESFDISKKKFEEYSRITPFSKDIDIIVSKIYILLFNYRSMLPDYVKDSLNKTEKNNNNNNNNSSDSESEKSESSKNSGSIETRNISKFKTFVSTKRMCIVVAHFDNFFEEEESEEGVENFELVLSVVENMLTKQFKKGKIEEYNSKKIFVSFPNHSIGVKFGFALKRKLIKINTENMSNSLSFIKYTIAVSKGMIQTGIIGCKTRKTYQFFGEGKRRVEMIANYGSEYGKELLIDGDCSESIQSQFSFELDNYLFFFKKHDTHIISVYKISPREQAGEHRYMLDQKQEKLLRFHEMFGKKLAKWKFTECEKMLSDFDENVLNVSSIFNSIEKEKFLKKIKKCCFMLYMEER